MVPLPCGDVCMHMHVCALTHRNSEGAEVRAGSRTAAGQDSSLSSLLLPKFQVLSTTRLLGIPL